MAWIRDGGGCFVGGKCAKRKCACDDDYVSRKRGHAEERITAFTTMERHLDMPERVANPQALKKLRGVCKVKRSKD